jgi:DNA replication protein DnaC
MIDHKIKVFYSYSHKDENLREMLESHLSALRRQGYIDDWHDRKLIPGSDWDASINDRILSADLILFLISSDFIASDYCYDLEVKKAIELYRDGKCLIVPIILRECDWSDTPFSKIQGLPTDMKPIVSKHWHNIDEAFTDVIKKLKKTINELIVAKKITIDKIRKLSDSNIRINNPQDIYFFDSDLINEIITNYLAINSFNSIFILGKRHSGKTTLINEIAYRFLNKYPASNIKLFPYIQFSKDFANSVRTNNLSDFRKELMTSDLIIFDDIEFLANRYKSQAIFIDIFNELCKQNKKVVFASTDSPDSFKKDYSEDIINIIHDAKLIEIKKIYAR